MEKNEKKFALLGKAKNAAVFAGSFLVNLMTGKNKSVIDFTGLENIPAKQRQALVAMLDVDAMFRAKKYDILIRLGLVEEFIKRGLVDELIARYPEFKKELGRGTYAQVISLVDEGMLDNYLKNRKSRTFKFFIIHPLGLKTMVKHHYSGYIASQEKAFRRIAEKFPEEFKPYISQREYVELLNRVLD